MSPAHFDYLLRLADNPLILGQRLAQWCGHGPVLEEDLALANTALDLIGQARLLLTYAGACEGKGRDEDQLAFLRGERAFRNWTLVELPNGDFGRSVLRNFLYSACQLHRWDGLQQVRDAQLAGIAAKSLTETRYHLRHASDWVVRLGDGTEESHARMQTALDQLWPYTAELFHDDAVENDAAAAGIGPAASSLRAPWEATVRPLLAEATLAIPAGTPFLSRGKQGLHSEHMGHLLAEMQSMQRSFPGARW